MSSMHLGEINPDRDVHQSYREPPSNLEAEQALLGAIMVNNRAYEKVCEFLSPEHFFDPINGEIYDACASVIESGKQASPVTLKGRFDTHEALKDEGGAQYLVRLAASVITVVNAEDYGRTILGAFQRRQLIDLCETAVNRCYSDFHTEITPADIVAPLMTGIDDVSAGKEPASLVHVTDAFDKALGDIEAAVKGEEGARGVRSGINDLDHAVGPLFNKRLYILGGRPGMMKTGLALQYAWRAAKQGKRVAFFSLEMGREELAKRLFAIYAGISQEKQDGGLLDGDDVRRLVLARQELSELPLWIDDEPAPSVAQIQQRARKLSRKGKLDLIIVDYLQLVAPGNTSRYRNANRTQDVTEICAGLRQMAKNLDAPVIALSQLSRALESRENKRPMMADLRESGAIEQDAHVVMFVYRDEYYAEKEEPPPGSKQDLIDAWDERMERSRNVLEVIVGKRRGGPPGRRCNLHVDLELGRVENLYRGN